MACEKRSFNIVTGPSKFDLLLALFEGRKVVFEVEDSLGKYSIEVKIVGIVSVVGDNEHWNICGVIHSSSNDLTFWIPYYFNGSYNTRNMNGIFEHINI